MSHAPKFVWPERNGAERRSGLLMLRSSVARLAPVGRGTSQDEVLRRFSSDPNLFILPVLDEFGTPIGVIDRQRFLGRIGVETQAGVHQGALADDLISTPPLVIDINTPMSEFTREWRNCDAETLLRGYIVVEDGAYLGIGNLFDLLQAASDIERSGLDALTRANSEIDDTRLCLSLIIESIPAMVFVKEVDDQRYILINKAGEDILGYSRNDIIGRRDIDLFSAERAGAFRSHDEMALMSATPVVIDEQEVERRDGKVVQLRAKRLVVAGRDKQAKYIIGVYQDISEQKKAEAQIARLAHFDPLTGLPNRVMFLKGLRDTLARAKRSREEVTVLCIDLDRFKVINETLGHEVGDALLKAAAERLEVCVRDGETLARLGADKFSVAQNGGRGVDAASALFKRVTTALSVPFDVFGNQIMVEASFGAAISPQDGVDPEELLKKADVALYRAKAQGRGALNFFEPAMDHALQARRRLEIDLRNALAAGEFTVYYQPLFSLGNDEVQCCEALVRWNHPQRGLVSPLEFVPLAEEIGLINPLGQWVLQQACTEAARWPDTVRVAVNISPLQFRNGRLVDTVISALANSGLPASRLELEITESVLLQDSDGNLSALHALRGLGVKISMDDFGTGYSSLSYLRSFPFDKIKIDQSFIRDLPNEPDALAIVKAVMALGASLGIRTTAEGVETQEQLSALRVLGCQEIQGYLVSQPVTANEIGMLFGLKPATQRRRRAVRRLSDHVAAATRIAQATSTEIAHLDALPMILAQPQAVSRRR